MISNVSMSIVPPRRKRKKWSTITAHSGARRRRMPKSLPITMRRAVRGVARRSVQVSDSFSWAIAVAEITQASTLSIPQRMKAKGICDCGSVRRWLADIRRYRKSRIATTTHAAATDCQRRRKSGRRVSRHRTGFSGTGREVDLGTARFGRGGWGGGGGGGLWATGREVDLGTGSFAGGGGGSGGGEVGECGSGGVKFVSSGGKLMGRAGAGAGAGPLDSDSRRATRRRLTAASSIR